MQTDRYTRCLLTLIAFCLVILTLESLSAHLAPEAHATTGIVVEGVDAKDTVSCRVPGNGYKRCLPVIIGQ